jgi:hypothetical protein
MTASALAPKFSLNAALISEFDHHLISAGTISYFFIDKKTDFPVCLFRKGLVFIDKHTQPSDNPCMGDLMTKYYGRFTPEITIRNILGPFQSGMPAAVT